MTHQPYSNKIFKSSIIAALVSALSITGIIACSDVQNTGITNRDVAEAQRSIITTESGEQPLYVINGERMDMEESGDIISRIKPKYIKSINVLKRQKAVDEYGQAGRNGVVQLHILNKEKAFRDLMDAPPPVTQNREEHADFFVVVEEMPELIGGLKSIQKNIRYPEEARKAGIEGRVIVQFIVNKQGEVEHPQIIRGVGGALDEEALRVVSQAKFKPGKQRGKPVRVQYSLPIVFRLASTDDMSSWKPSAREAGDPDGIEDKVSEENVMPALAVVGYGSPTDNSPGVLVEDPSVVTKKFVLKDVSSTSTGVVSGKVLDADTNKPLAGANIIINGTSIGTSTDLAGEFRLQDLPPGNHEISVSYIGYKMTGLHLTVK